MCAGEADAGDTIAETVTAHAGSFHHMCSFLCSWGAAFRDTHLLALVQHWHGVDGKLASVAHADWVLAPGDPTDTLAEMHEYLLGQYIVA